MGVQIRTDNLPYKFLIPVLRFYKPGTRTCNTYCTGSPPPLCENLGYSTSRASRWGVGVVSPGRVVCHIFLFILANG